VSDDGLKPGQPLAELFESVNQLVDFPILGKLLIVALCTGALRHVAVETTSSAFSGELIYG